MEKSFDAMVTTRFDNLADVTSLQLL